MVFSFCIRVPPGPCQWFPAIGASRFDRVTWFLMVVISTTLRAKMPLAPIVESAFISRKRLLAPGTSEGRAPEIPITFPGTILLAPLGIFNLKRLVTILANKSDRQSRRLLFVSTFQALFRTKVFMTLAIPNSDCFAALLTSNRSSVFRPIAIIRTVLLFFIAWLKNNLALKTDFFRQFNWPPLEYVFCYYTKRC